jgi:hypothetical protein
METKKTPKAKTGIYANDTSHRQSIVSESASAVSDSEESKLSRTSKTSVKSVEKQVVFRTPILIGTKDIPNLIAS